MNYRPQWLAEGVEDLFSALDSSANEEVDFDVVVVGSGYGGAVAAARLAQATIDDNGTRLRVCVLERGQEYVPGTFPGSFSELPGCVRFSRYDDPKSKGQADGLFDFRLGADISVLVGNGLGGGSLINASVAERATKDVFADPAWPAELRRDLTTLEACYDRAEKILGVVEAEVGGAAKYEQLEAFAKTIGERARRAKVAVTFEVAKDRNGKTEPNAQGVMQQTCLRTGNCVTGCNNWAKNTLAMNYLPLAKRCGARLFVNATVTHVQKIGGENVAPTWQVHVRQTSQRHPQDDQDRFVRARHVVLAAGTLGSTEILMRSRAPGLRFSEKLGARFSGNGDMISVLYGQRDRVNAAPEEDAEIERDVGPTIIGVIETGSTRADRIVIEELGIPSPLRRVFEEIVTTGALPVGLVRFDGSTHHPDGLDPVAVDPDLIERTQIFAAMGDDGARGRLEMVDGWESAAGSGAIKMEWNNAGAEAVYQRQDEILRKSEALGGSYLRNPMWRPLPEEVSGILSGEKPQGKLLTVHPLGGCAMGDDWGSGVVDHIGRVYDPTVPSDRTRIHQGLLVLDGAIVPTALGINPLLTITALAERAIARYAVDRGWEIDYKRTPGKLPDLPKTPQVKPAAKSNTAIRFAEKMKGDLALLPTPGKPVAMELEVEFAEIGDIREFLRTGPHTVKLEKASLSAIGGEPASVTGSVYWMERDETGPWGRSLKVFWTWLWARGISDFFQRRREGKGEGWTSLLKLKTWKSLWASAKLFFNLGSNVGEVRLLRYEMQLQSDLKHKGALLLPKDTHIVGLKTLAYVSDGNPWRQLSELTVTVTQPCGVPREVGKLSIDLAHMVRRFAAQLQIVRHLDQPSAFMDLASIGLFLARVVAKVHFWSFRLPVYEKHLTEDERIRRRTPGALDGLKMEHHSVTAPVSSSRSKGNLVLPLTRYRDETKPGALPVLLIHGFGSGGIQFCHPKLERNLVRHLAENGFDVWVAELRTSIAVPSSFHQWTLDEVARNDIPAIVQQVLKASKHDKLDVVAHCIGSAMFCSAALAGTLDQQVRSAVLLQVGPLITLSEGNRFRGYMAAAMRRYMAADFLYSSVDSSADWKDALLDRILYTYPYPESELSAHKPWPPCELDTHIANCNRSAGVFGRLFQHENVDPSMLDALGDMLGHTNIRTFEQTGKYALSMRLTDYDGCNTYVTDENIKKHFGFSVLFMHGEKNDVFHPKTTERSLRLLVDIFGSDAKRRDRKLIPGYGHLDPLIGKTAEYDVYGDMSKFLHAAAKLDPSKPLDRHPRFALPPLIGPVLGWTCKKGDQWIARIWCRTDDEYVPAHFVIAVVLDTHGIPVPGYAFKMDLRMARRPVPDILCVNDIPLPGLPDQDFEILMVGAYASVERDTKESDRPSVQLLQESAAVGAKKAHHHVCVDPSSVPGLAKGVCQLRAGYGESTLEERVHWEGKMEQGAEARRVCDLGYEARRDSVVLSRKLLDRLDPSCTSINFAVGSCRYPAAMVDRERADASFGRLRDLIDAKGPDAPSLLLLAGDQIYADATAGLFDPKDRRSRFYDAYREVWTAPNAREVLRQLPTYMMLDDHEVCDDWHPQDECDEERERNKEWGLGAVKAYQLEHSPNNAAELCEEAGVPLPVGATGKAPAYFYSFDAGGFGFFACDTRTGRKDRKQIMSDEQFAALTCWLERKQGDSNYGDRPKFVLSPSVVVPFLKATRGGDAYAARSDGWDGFPDSLCALFSFIAEKRIQNVVFLCGDPHLSMASKITFEGEGVSGLRALCIVASPFYAPYPFANAKAEDFVDDGALPLEPAGSANMRYERKLVAEGDSFTMVGVNPTERGWSVSASVYCGADAPTVMKFDLPRRT
ncbi:MAG: alpha/beta fold hydrolase [Burkholderiales bacterium]|nr:alpha/beta fold hydrolase [Burkholderiales bacterium]